MRKILGTLLICCLALHASSNVCKAEAGQTSDAAARIAQLIEQLGDDSYQERMNARWELERIGLAAFGQLREAVNHPNIQIANAARYMVQSQNVIWWLETDSIDVRRLLLEYNALSLNDRDTRLQAISKLESDDASIALCRLARFESNERLSKSAALYLMEKIVIADGLASPTLPQSIALTIENAERPATAWLRALANDISSGKTDINLWREFTKQESTAVLNASRTSSRPEQSMSRSHALRFYKWTGNWLILKTDRASALIIARDSLSLVGDDPPSCSEFSLWALAAGMPELVIELAQSKTIFFENEPALGYLLAEAHLRAGHVEDAERLAKAASEQFNVLAEKAKQRLQLPNVIDSVAIGRRNIAIGELSSRGLYDWAEAELKLALELEASPHVEFQVRNALADFYWGGGKYREAAEVMEPMLAEDGEQDEDNLPGRPSDQSEIRAFYNYYLGLAAIQDGDKQRASELLGKSLELSANPDVVIALNAIADEEPLRSKFLEEFEKMAADFRVLVATNEHALARLPDRNTRSSVAYVLAVDCNQLAWLLSKCNSSPEEAINLSLRSLEFDPGNPAYLDTLGRCYFAAGELDEAVVTQRKAVAAAPFDRQMRVQLSEFESASDRRRMERQQKEQPTPNE